MITWEDFCQYYQNTFFRVSIPHLDVKVVVYFRDISDKKYFIANTVEFKDLVLKFDSSLAIDYSIPKVRMFEHEGSVFSFERLPARQWTRGVCQKNSRIMSPLKTCGIGVPPYSLKVMKSAWESLPQPSLLLALEKLNLANQIGVTLTDNFWISESFDNNMLYMLWYNQFIIGRINPEDHQITVGFPIMKQEVIDYLHITKEETNWDVKV